MSLFDKPYGPLERMGQTVALACIAFIPAIILGSLPDEPRNFRAHLHEAEQRVYGGYKDRIWYLLGDNIDDGEVNFNPQPLTISQLLKNIERQYSGY